MRIKVIYFITMVLVILGCQESAKVNLGKDYFLIHSASMNDLTIVDKNNIQIIEGHVLDYTFDKNFIVLAQRPRDSVRECSSKTNGISLKSQQAAFERSTFKQYWIINLQIISFFNEHEKKYTNVFGPYKYDEYLAKRNELDVSDTLKLLNIEDFREKYYKEREE